MPVTLLRKSSFVAMAAIAAVISAPPVARAQLVLSELVVELEPVERARHDIEVQNSGTELLYVAVAPREVVGSGTTAMSSREDPDPEKLGLLVSPSRMVLDPGKRKLLRLAALTGPVDRERVFRVTVKPVVGELSSNQAGLKVLVGYEILVLVRPAAPRMEISALRSGNSLLLRNTGNASVEMMSGQQCDDGEKSCQPLPGGRLYTGAERTISIDPRRPVTYTFKQGAKLISKQY